METRPTVRRITTHIVDGKNHNEAVVCIDKPGQGGACHEYQLGAGDTRTEVYIPFQNGPIQEVGVNGVSNEQLLAVIIDRLELFQNGPFACAFSSQALQHARACMDWMLKRTRDRLNRGVEGRNQA